MSHKTSKVAHDSTDDSSPRRKSSTLKREITASLTSSNEGSSPERRSAKVDAVQIPKSDFEKELRDFMSAFTYQKNFTQGEISNSTNYLRKIILGLIKENLRLAGSPASPTKPNKGAESIQNDGNALLQKRVVELEAEKVVYEQKLKTHAVYIAELEGKVNKLIEEYRKCLEKNENVNSHAEPPFDHDEITKTLKDANSHTNTLTSLIENEQRLYEENTRIKAELIFTKQKLVQLESSIQSAIAINSEVESSEKYRALLQQNIILNDKLKQQFNDITSLKSQIIGLEKEKNSIIQLAKEAEEKIISAYTAKTSNLSKSLKESESKLAASVKKCEHLKKIIQTKNEMENLLKSRSVVIQDLEGKLDTLINENDHLMQVNQENSMLITSLNTHIHSSPMGKYTSPRSFEEAAKGISILNDYQEDGDKKSDERSQIANSTLENYEDKIKKLNSVNSKLVKEVESLKTEYVNCRTAVRASTKKLLQCLESYHTFDVEIEKKFASLMKISNQELTQLRSLYNSAKNDVLNIIEIVNDRQKIA